MHRITAPIAAASLLALAVPSAAADSPLPPPTETKFRSQNERFLAVSDPVTSITTVYELNSPPGTRKKQWSMFGWVREAALADDGEHLLVVTPHLNLIPIDYDRNNPVLLLVHKGELVKTVSVMDVVRGESNLTRTTSHYAWGTFLGTDRSGRFRVRTANGSVFFMHLTTGAAGVEPAGHLSPTR